MLCRELGDLTPAPASPSPAARSAPHAPMRLNGPAPAGTEPPWEAKGGSADTSRAVPLAPASGCSPAAARPAAARSPGTWSCAQGIKLRAVRVRPDGHLGVPGGVTARAPRFASRSRATRGRFRPCRGRRRVAQRRRVAPSPARSPSRAATWCARCVTVGLRSWDGPAHALRLPLVRSRRCCWFPAGRCGPRPAVCVRRLGSPSGLGQRGSGGVPRVRLGPALRHRCVRAGRLQARVRPECIASPPCAFELSRAGSPPPPAPAVARTPARAPPHGPCPIAVDPRPPS